jgi:transcriptional regulator with XRE-family HTH domain
MAIIEKATKRTAALTAKPGGPDPVDIHVGIRLRLRRTLLDMTQEQVASRVGVTFQQLQKYERGVNRVSASRLYDLARCLSVQVGYFFEDLGDDLSRPTQNIPAPIGVDAPAAAAQPRYERDDMSRNETLQIVRSYWRLPDAEARKHIRGLLAYMERKR